MSHRGRNEANSTECGTLDEVVLSLAEQSDVRMSHLEMKEALRLCSTTTCIEEIISLTNHERPEVRSDWGWEVVFTRNTLHSTSEVATNLFKHDAFVWARYVYQIPI